ncbi:MAG: amidophosphoribosyltransferase [Planctomycetota bacterium]
MCGIVGIVGNRNVNQQLYDALTVLQHRGQDAAGIATDDGGRYQQRRDNGLVRDVFRQKHMNRLQGKMGIAHCRYPTAGCPSSSEAQPFYVNSPFGIALAHNGNLTNHAALVDDLFRTDRRHINTSSDSEVLLNVFAHELNERPSEHPDAEDVFAACVGVHRRCKGAYAIVAMIIGHGIVGMRDPHGIRPLCLGQRKGLYGTEWMFASESVALDTLGFEFVRDVQPGEAVYIESDGTKHERVCAPESRLTPCIFEQVYLARPDSMIDGISVYKARLRMGEKLAEKVRREMPDHDIDVVMPIPDSGRTAALAMAGELRVKFREGFIKNRYIGRTFIMPGQTERRRSVRKKLNPIDLEFRGKVVCLVDDSIVRGTTCSEIIQMARSCGAKKVYYCSAAPAVRHPNVYGIDMPSAPELIAHGKRVEEIAKEIGADWLVYQDLEDLIACAKEGNPKIDGFECSVFDGRYVTGDVDAAYLEGLDASRNDAAKAAAAQSRQQAGVGTG